MKLKPPFNHTITICAGLCLWLGTLLPPAMALAAPTATQPGGFQYFIGIVGNPSVPNISWSDDELEQIKALGVNMVQLSIAWGGKPADEVLNLEDLDAAQRAKWAFRIKQAKKHGLEVMAQFGIPKALNADPVEAASVLDPAVRQKYVKLLTNFMNTFPDVDNVMVYTFDQNAWLCSEFGPNTWASGIPLDDRLPQFLNLLSDTMQKCRPHTRLWWKPWELSIGQVVAVLKKVNPDHFGLMLNPSTSSEVYPFNDRSFSSDPGLVRFVRIAKRRNIPVIGEFDETLYKPLYQMQDFFPRLVYDVMEGWKRMPEVIGVKEYYGFSPTNFSVNTAMLKAWMHSPDAPLDTLLDEISAPYGKKTAPLMREAWEYVAQSVEAFPWDTTYLIGPMGLDTWHDGSHDWEPAKIPNATWDTPIWKANRRAHFMLTESDKADPWLFEDAGLRLQDCADLSFAAVKYYDQAIAQNEDKVADIREEREIVWKTGRNVMAVSLHIMETLAAQDARNVQNIPERFARVTKRLEGLLEQDVKNQGGRAEVTQKLAEFKKDAKSWLKVNLNPRAYESDAAVDWGKWVPPVEIETKTKN